jgi:hypothetical protein
MKRKKLKELLKYEVTLLRFVRQVEEGVKSFGVKNIDLAISIPSENYELLQMVLDELDAPKDNALSRDRYMDEYYSFWNSDSEEYGKLIKSFEEIRDEDKTKFRIK